MRIWYEENLCGITFHFTDKNAFGYRPPNIMKRHRVDVGLKDNPTNIPEGKIPVRCVFFRNNRKLFDEVLFFGKEEFTKDRDDNGLITDTKESKTYEFWMNQVKEKHREKLEKKYGDEWDRYVWWEYSIFNFKNGSWDSFRHIWGERKK